MRHEVFKDGFLAQTQLRTHRLRWYHRHEFAMMLTSVGFREVTVKYGYIASESLELTAPQQSARATFPILANSRD